MNVEDVVKLIKACKNSGVHLLKLDTLELQFSPSGPTAIRAPIIDPPKEPVPADIARAIEREIEEDQDLKDLQDSILMIEDPLAFEANLRRD